jgi:hypothetical protein
VVVVIGDDLGGEVGFGDTDTDGVDGTGRPPTPELRGGWRFPTASVRLLGLPVAVWRKGFSGL